MLAADTGPHAISELAGTAGTGTDSASTTLSFTDADLNDTHTVAYAAPTVSWSAAGGTVPATTLAALATALSLTTADSTGNGAGSVKADFSLADGLADFLAVGETLTVTYNVSVSDTHGRTSVQPVTFTITGTNDAPVLGVDATSPHAISELASSTGVTAADGAGGVLSFTDVDLNDTHSVSAARTSVVWSNGTIPAATASALNFALGTHLDLDSTGTGTGKVAYGFNMPDNTLDFLAAGERLTVSYDISVIDNHGVVSTQPVNFKITGTNDQPVLSADAGTHATSESAGAAAGTGADTASATLDFTDADLKDTHTVSYALASPASWAGGTIPSATATALNSALTLSKVDSTDTGSGSVTAAFSLADKLADFLAAGETLTATYNVTVNDGKGGASTQPVTFTVTGANDKPVLAGPPSTAQTIDFSTAPTGRVNAAFGDYQLDGFYYFGASSGYGAGGSATAYFHSSYNAAAGGADGEVRRTDGGAFSLQSFDVSRYSAGTSSFTVLGYLHGGVVVS